MYHSELLDKSDKIIELMTLQESRQYRVPCGELTVMEQIGRGSSKLVSKAKWGSRNVAVAYKQFSDLDIYNILNCQNLASTK
jgi:hypothetical protein